MISSLFHRFFFGKNKVMIIALGKRDTDEYKDNLHKVSKISDKLEKLLLWFTAVTQYVYSFW